MTSETAKAASSLAEQIRSWLPDHAHMNREFTGKTVWTWTTPVGVWNVMLGGVLGSMGGSPLTVTGPGGQWAWGRADDAALREARGVLLALGAIGGES